MCIEFMNIPPFIQVYSGRWLSHAQLLAYLLQNHQQHTSTTAHPAHTAEAASQSRPPQTGIISLNTLLSTVCRTTNCPLLTCCFAFVLSQNNTAKLVKQLSKSAETEGEVAHMSKIKRSSTHWIALTWTDISPCSCPFVRPEEIGICAGRRLDGHNPLPEHLKQRNFSCW